MNRADVRIETAASLLGKGVKICAKGFKVTVLAVEYILCDAAPSGKALALASGKCGIDAKKAYDCVKSCAVTACGSHSEKASGVKLSAKKFLALLAEETAMKAYKAAWHDETDAFYRTGEFF